MYGVRSAQLGAIPPSVSIKCKILNFWCNLVTGEDEKMSRLMYDYLFKQFSRNIYRSPWLVYVQTLLGECGFLHIWESQSVGNVMWFKKAIKLRLEHQFKQGWLGQVLHSAKCYNYRLYKEVFGFESYLIQLPWQLRHFLCKFRTTNHKLAVEQGRYANVVRHQRFCNICNERKLGDEYHFIMECVSLDDIRRTYLPRYIVRHRNTLAFTRLMTTSSVRTKTQLCRFIIEGMQRIV